MNIRQTICVTTLVLALTLPLHLHGQCGGTERWPVKVGSDNGAAGVNLSPVPISIHDLVRIERPQLPDDDETRLTEEKRVYVVEGYLVKFKAGVGSDRGSRTIHTSVFTDNSPPVFGRRIKERSRSSIVSIAEVVNPRLHCH